jgi:hypothetical protein
MPEFASRSELAGSGILSAAQQAISPTPPSFIDFHK